MYKRLLFLPCLLILKFTLAQEVVPTFGMLSMDEMLMKSCSFEPSAPAMILYDIQETRITENKIVSERRVRIKVFNQAGTRYASIVIPYVSKKKASKITDIEGYTYNMDAAGNIITTRLSQKDLFKNKVDEKFSSIRFAFPDVKPGTVIEYRYAKTEKDIFHVEPWLFQRDIPTQLSFLKLTVPIEADVKHRIVSSLNVATTLKKAKDDDLAKELGYVLREVPGFRDEPYMTSVKDNLHRVEFSYFPRYGLFSLISGENGWRFLNRALYRSAIGVMSRKPINGTTTVIDSISRLATDTAKINAVYNFVRNTIPWDKRRTFYPEDVQEAWDSKTGSSAEINVIILNLLKSVGIKSYPMMVSTRSHGKVDKSFANLGQFNTLDVLALDAAGQYYVLDGTLRNQSYNVPPLNVLNTLGLAIDSLDGLWVNVEDSRPLLKSSIAAFAHLGIDGVMEGEASMSYFDLARSMEMDRSAEEEDPAENYLNKDFTEFKIDSLREENTADVNRPLISHFRFSLKLNKTGNFIFMDPFLLSTMQKNPFRDSVRLTDLHFGANTRITYNLSVTLPDSVTVADMPRSTGIRMADSSISYIRRLELRGKLLQVQSTLEFKRSTFHKDEYPYLRQVFDAIYKLNTEQVALRIGEDED